jgi:type II secretory pathway pseudopilin PulG
MVYLTGVAIGFVLLGWFASRRGQEAAERQRQAAESAARSAANAGEPAPAQPVTGQTP